MNAPETPPAIKYFFDDPIVISQAPSEIRNWGPWQFPTIQRLPDQRLQIKFKLGKDSAKAYGAQAGGAFSSDNGQTWSRMEPVAESFLAKIVKLPNGDLLRHFRQTPVEMESIQDQLPPEIGRVKHSYIDEEYIFYRAAEMPPEAGGWLFQRKPAGSNAWQDELAQVNLPGELRYSIEGVIPRSWFRRIRPAPDGSLWAIHYTRRTVNGAFRPKLAPFFMRSTKGRVWDFISEIEYQPDPEKDPLWDQRQGFTEPDIAFLPDGSIFCLMRTTDGNGIGPSYQARSTNGGKTWTKPQVFDDLGVLPTLLQLKCGVLVAAYGRPGLFLRATDDPQAWYPRVPLVKPLDKQADTCSYADMLALDDHTFLVVYSDFNHPNRAGKPCKTILLRRVQVSL